MRASVYHRNRIIHLRSIDGDSNEKNYSVGF